MTLMIAFVPIHISSRPADRRESLNSIVKTPCSPTFPHKMPLFVAMPTYLI